jgi:hypothetical protein
MTAILWEVAGGKNLRTFKGHVGEPGEVSISGVVLSANSKKLVTGSWDDTAILWQAASGKTRPRRSRLVPPRN